MKKFILSKTFPLFFLRSCCVIVLISLFIALSLMSKYEFDAGYTYLVYAKELIFSAAGIASIALSAYYCLTKNQK